MFDLLFGTDGMRALMGHFPLTIEDLPKLGYAIATWARLKNNETPHILIAHDTRTSCHFIKAALKSGLLLQPTKVFDALALPTPAACFLTRFNKAFNGGIIITASHNNYLYNGLKIIDGSGCKINNDDEKMIADLFKKTHFKSMSYNLGNEFRALNAGEPYIHGISKHFKPQFLKGKKIVLDCAHGATSSLAPHIFSTLGAEVIALNTHPIGTNINENCGTLFPESIKKAVVKESADCGFVFDGDGGRVLAINQKGVLKDGDDILALLIDSPVVSNAQAIVGTTFSNGGLADYVQNKGKKFIQADVGEKAVCQEMRLHKAPLGGEPSGSIIISKHIESGDGIFVAIALLDAITKTGNWQMESFDHVPQVMAHIPVKAKGDISKPPISTIIQKNRQIFPACRSVIRFSETEPILRILVESDSKQEAELMCTKLSNQLREVLEK